MRFLKVSKVGKFYPVKKFSADESHPTAIGYEILFNSDDDGNTNVSINVGGKCTGLESEVLGELVKSKMKGNIVKDDTKQTQQPFVPAGEAVRNKVKERIRRNREEAERARER